MTSGPITAWQIEGKKVEVVTDFLFLGSKITVDSDCSHEIRWLLLGRKATINLDSLLKSRDITLLTKLHIFKAMVFPVVTYGCESWTVKKAKHWRIDSFKLWCWRRLLKVHRTSREIKPVNPNGNQPWIFTGRTDAETPTLCQPDVKSQLTGKDPHAGKDCEQEKGATEDKMIGWHYWLNGHEFEWTLEDSEGQGKLAFCSL